MVDELSELLLLLADAAHDLGVDQVRVLTAAAAAPHRRFRRRSRRRSPGPGAARRVGRRLDGGSVVARAGEPRRVGRLAAEPGQGAQSAPELLARRPGPPAYVPASTERRDLASAPPSSAPWLKVRGRPRKIDLGMFRWREARLPASDRRHLAMTRRRPWLLGGRARPCLGHRRPLRLGRRGHVHLTRRGGRGDRRPRRSTRAGPCGPPRPWARIARRRGARVAAPRVSRNGDRWGGRGALRFRVRPGGSRRGDTSGLAVARLRPRSTSPILRASVPDRGAGCARGLPVCPPREEADSVAARAERASPGARRARTGRCRPRPGRGAGKSRLIGTAVGRPRGVEAGLAAFTRTGPAGVGRRAAGGRSTADVRVGSSTGRQERTRVPSDAELVGEARSALWPRRLRAHRRRREGPRGRRWRSAMAWRRGSAMARRCVATRRRHARAFGRACRRGMRPARTGVAGRPRRRDRWRRAKHPDAPSARLAPASAAARRLPAPEPLPVAIPRPRAAAAPDGSRPDSTPERLRPAAAVGPAEATAMAMAMAACGCDRRPGPFARALLARRRARIGPTATGILGKRRGTGRAPRPPPPAPERLGQATTERPRWLRCGCRRRRRGWSSGRPLRPLHVGPLGRRLARGAGGRATHQRTRRRATPAGRLDASGRRCGRTARLALRRRLWLGRRRLRPLRRRTALRGPRAGPGTRLRGPRRRGLRPRDLTLRGCRSVGSGCGVGGRDRRRGGITRRRRRRRRRRWRGCGLWGIGAGEVSAGGELVEGAGGAASPGGWSPAHQSVAVAPGRPPPGRTGGCIAGAGVVEAGGVGAFVPGETRLVLEAGRPCSTGKAAPWPRAPGDGSKVASPCGPPVAAEVARAAPTPSRPR